MFKSFKQFISESNVRNIPVKDIYDPQGVLDDDAVDKYAKKIKAGEKVNPIILLLVTEKTLKKKYKYYIYDGTHRFHGHIKAGKNTVSVVIAYDEDEANRIQMRQ